MRVKRLVLVAIVLVVWGLVLFGFYHVVAYHTENPDKFPVAVVTYTALLVALAGWMIQSWLSMRNMRKQHTINVLFQTRMNEIWKQNVEEIQGTFPESSSISYADAKDPKNVKAYEAIRFVLNYYEFISVAVEHGDLDEKVLRDCIGTNLCTFCARTEDFIIKVRAEDAKGHPSPEKARLLRSLRQVSKRWQKRLDRQIRRRRQWALIRRAATLK